MNLSHLIFPVVGRKKNYRLYQLVFKTSFTKFIVYWVDRGGLLLAMEVFDLFMNSLNSTEFPCFLGHPVENLSSRLLTFHFNLNKLGKGKIPAKICSPLIIPIKIIQSVPRNMGIQWRIGYRLCYELAL